MSSLNEFETLDVEVRELLKNYKHKKATTYEPCSLDNIKECLLGLSEELDLLNIKYTFNPYIDIENDTLRQGAVVSLINSVWSLLHTHKNTAEQSNRFAEQNYSLEHCNKQLNILVDNLKLKLKSEKNESRACVASAHRISGQSEEIHSNMIETRKKLQQVVKQKEATEKNLFTEIARLKLENEKLLSRVRSSCGNHSSCSELCDTSLLRLKEQDRKQKVIISKLQSNNHDLLQEVLALKEELVFGSV